MWRRCGQQSTGLLRHCARAWAITFCCLLAPQPRLQAWDAPVDPATAGQVQESVANHWSARRSEIITADVHYRQVERDVTDSTLTSAAIREVVSRLDPVDPGSRWEEVLRVLSGPASPPAVDASCRVVSSGDRTRYEFAGFCTIRDGELELVFDGDNQQVGVYPRGRSQRRIGHLGLLRWIPPTEVDLRKFRVESAGPSALMLASLDGSVRNRIDPETGLLAHVQDFEPETGELVGEAWELGIAQFADGIPFPTLKIETTYRAGRLVRYALRHVQQADFNLDLPDEVFQMSNERGTAVLDYRGGTKQGYFLPEATTHLAATVDAPGRRVAPPRPLTTVDRAAYRWLLALNGLLLICGGAYLWRRDRHAARTADTRASESVHRSN